MTSSSSMLFDELIMRRCEEITQNDEPYQGISNKILELESKIKALVPEHIKKIIIEYERLNTDLMAHAYALLYRQGIEDTSSLTK